MLYSIPKKSQRLSCFMPAPDLIIVPGHIVAESASRQI
jgi:hypothetical protein